MWYSIWWHITWWYIPYGSNSSTVYMVFVLSFHVPFVCARWHSCNEYVFCILYDTSYTMIYDPIRYDAMRCDAMRHDTRHSMIYGMRWYMIIWYDIHVWQIDHLVSLLEKRKSTHEIKCKPKILFCGSFRFNTQSVPWRLVPASNLPFNDENHFFKKPKMVKPYTGIIIIFT